MKKIAILFCSPTCHNCKAMEDNMEAAGMRWIHADITEDNYKLEAAKIYVYSFPTLVFYGVEPDGKMVPLDTYIGLLPVYRINEIYNPADDGLIIEGELTQGERFLEPLTKDTAKGKKSTPVGA